MDNSMFGLPEGAALYERSASRGL
ncbi:hypothetical protein CGLO_12290 [Colletotrichum gloeosporioides Cg-14]|uniref:Uncharacterized protein n=1 Tax=Colletotrichum gloeosporioides (strain Cg-14) TaxID=1237896 RepID=T0L9Z2_COLGC|nr:hypothetical protein CGLO_12290 [Colletotrichum gloeosporioides Cg-14]